MAMKPNRKPLLEDCGMYTEEDVAAILDVSVKTLKNRSVDDLPPFSKAGGKRLFFKEDVVAFLRQRMSR